MRRDLALATFYWMLLALWMLLIFGFSAQAAHQSKEVSLGLTDLLVRFINFCFPLSDVSVASWHSMIRKMAHLFLYFVLGILMIHALRTSRISWKRGLFLALLFCFLYAVSDEYHQFFIPGRGAQASDVVLDSGGSALGVLSYYLWKRK